MAKFKNPNTDEIFEVSEEHANAVLRPQKKYIEIEGDDKVSTEVKPKGKSQEAGSSKKKKKKILKKKKR